MINPIGNPTIDLIFCRFDQMDFYGTGILLNFLEKSQRPEKVLNK